MEEEKKKEEEYEFLIPLTLDYKLKTFVGRYFLKYYKIIEQNKQFCPQYIFQHTNKLLMIGISKKHPIYEKQLKIKTINFLLCQNNDIKYQCIGKKKRGAIKIQQQTKVCEIITETNEIFYIVGMTKGHIIEFNELLINNPNILLEKPESEGFIFFALGNKSLENNNKFYNEQTFEKAYKEAINKKIQEQENLTN